MMHYKRSHPEPHSFSGWQGERVAFFWLELLFLFVDLVVHDGMPNTRQTAPIQQEGQPSQAFHGVVRKEIKSKEHENSTEQRYPRWRWFLFNERHIKAAPIKEHQPSAD